MTASILFGTESKLISLEEKNCTLFNRRKVACTTINYCLKYDGIGVDTQVGKFKSTYMYLFVHSY